MQSDAESRLVRECGDVDREQVSVRCRGPQPTAHRVEIRRGHDPELAARACHDVGAPAASAALAALGRGSDNEFFELLEPTVPLSRHIFSAPTRFYKTGVVFLAYLNGLQDHFAMIGGQQSTRSLQHLSELFRLADKARVLANPTLAIDRMRRVLAVHGVA